MFILQNLPDGSHSEERAKKRIHVSSNTIWKCDFGPVTRILLEFVHLYCEEDALWTPLLSVVLRERALSTPLPGSASRPCATPLLCV